MPAEFNGYISHIWGCHILASPPHALQLSSPILKTKTDTARDVVKQNRLWLSLGFKSTKPSSMKSTFHLEEKRRQQWTVSSCDIPEVYSLHKAGPEDMVLKQPGLYPWRCGLAGRQSWHDSLTSPRKNIKSFFQPVPSKPERWADPRESWCPSRNLSVTVPAKVSQQMENDQCSKTTQNRCS
jgi:hypothetical protein